MFGPWLVLIGSVIMIAIGISSLPEGHIHHGVRIPGWCEVLLIILFTVVGYMALLSILRGEGKPKKVEYTDEDVAKAKAEMDRIYLKKYGKLPDYPPASQEEAPGPEIRKDGPEPKP